MNPVYIESVGVYGPGLVGWDQTRAVLSGAAPYVPTPPPALKPARLAPDVRRRTTEHIRLAIEVATEATRELGDQAGALPSVFASAESDGAITHDICVEVAKDNPQVSPTRFHNSVTNAPAGYWCMAAGSRAASTSVAGYDASVAVGLLEAAAQLQTETPRLLLVVHDTPMPDPLQRVRPMIAAFGAAFVLTREGSPRSLARLSLTPTPIQKETPMPDAGLEQLHRGNPAARALPLLAALAAARATDIHLPYLAGLSLLAHVEPLT